MNRDEFIVCRDYASVDLVFTFFELVETIKENDALAESEERMFFGAPERGYFDWYMTVVRKLSVGEYLDFSGPESELKEIRNENKKRMDFFAELTDRLTAYEYVLNRYELKFSPENELDDFLRSNPEEEFLNRLITYLVGDGDKAAFGAKLVEVIGEIPIQITKNKLFEWIDRALTLYVGSDETALDEMIYMLRTAGLVTETGEYIGEYPELEKPLKDFETTDLKELTSEQYDFLRDEMYDLAGQLEFVIDFYMSLQRCVNNTLALCLVSKWLPEGDEWIMDKVVPTVKKIVNGEASEEDLIAYEGHLEGLSEKLNRQMARVEAPDMNAEEEESYLDVATVARLLSNSLFAEIDPLFVDTRSVTKEIIREKEDELFPELEKVMKASQRPVKKAIIAKVLEKLPPFLTSQSEIEEYVRTNLFGCRDKAEKCAVMAILIELMETS